MLYIMKRNFLEISKYNISRQLFQVLDSISRYLASVYLLQEMVPKILGTLLALIVVSLMSAIVVSGEALNATLDDVRGYWWWTWSTTNSAPTNTNVGIAFSGWADVNSAISESSNVYNKLPGTKILSIGGGNANGRFTSSTLKSLNDALSSGRLNDYHGISYDVEEGDSGLEIPFRDSFALAKRMGKTVIVTISHSAPYGVQDAGTLMRSFFDNGNIDYLSPQLYTSGTESSNDFSIQGGVQWSEYATAKAAIVPSIVRASLYSSAQQTFASYGVYTKGYIQWEQV